MLSIIITSLNENPYVLNKTIESIYNTCSKDEVEVIVVDDLSTIPVELENKNVILERNKLRLGVANSRHLGACIAKNQWLLFTDSHMIFHPDFYKNFLEYQKNAGEKTIYNGTCLGLWEDNFDYNTVNLDKLPHYHGARLSLYEEKDKQILEGKWIAEKKGDDNYEISCLMGAIYFIQKKHFFHIRGLSDLKMWGSDEPLLSLKTLLSGGEIRQLKNVKAAHVFRRSAPYNTDSTYLMYNKIRMAKTLLPDEMGKDLINRLNKDNSFNTAMGLINRENKFIQEHKNYYRSIFIKDINYLCDKFNI